MFNIFPLLGLILFLFIDCEDNFRNIYFSLLILVSYCKDPSSMSPQMIGKEKEGQYILKSCQSTICTMNLSNSSSYSLSFSISLGDKYTSCSSYYGFKIKTKL